MGDFAAYASRYLIGLLAVCLLAVLLAGCQTTTFTDQLGNAYASAEALSNTAKELCAAPQPGGECTGTITTSQRDRVYDVIAEALVLLDQAKATNSPEPIQRARSLLAIATRLVEERQ